MENKLKLSDLITDPPAGAKICPKCQGYGVIPKWEMGPVLSSADCNVCCCEGWIVKEGKG